MKEIIKDFLRKYTYPKWDGQSADEIAGMLVEELKQEEVKTRETVKLGGKYDAISVVFDNRVDEDYANSVNK